MRSYQAIIVSSATVLMLGLAQPARAQTDTAAPTIELVVAAGRPLEVALDQRITIKRVGQPITGTLVEPVYAYDRIVLPAGAKVLGHVAQLDGPSRLTRVRGILSGDLTPTRHVVLQFDTVMLDAGHTVPVQTVVGGGIPHLKRSVAAAPEATRNPGLAARTGEQAKTRAREAVAAAKQHARDTLSAITQPGKMERLKDAAIQRLPYHPQFLSKGTVYHADLIVPIGFGVTTPAAPAPTSTRPAPDSLLSARLVTTLNSAKTPRGTAVEAIVTEPVFSSDHQLILPEGSTLKGEVTLAKHARRFHRNGQLRFLFESAQVPKQDPVTLLAALHAVQANDGDHVAVDEEGGTTLTNPKTRFIAPALAILALRATTDHEHHRFDGDGDANDVAGASVQSGNAGSRAFGGFLGLSVLGVGLSQISHPVGVALAALGAARTVYANLLGKGKEVSFLAGTSIELQLAPGPVRQP